MSKPLLIVFVKNPELGKVKTRLAATIGQEQALEIYMMLLRKTKESIENLPVFKTIYYSSYIDRSDLWDNNLFGKALQQGNDLGEKMYEAFKSGFKAGYKSVGIIGSDCPDLSKDLLLDAYRKLKDHDLVIGPAKDGGYYFLGMNCLHKSLFFNKSWSTDRLLKETLKDAKRQKLSTHLLKTLSDIDEEKDLNNIKDFFKAWDQ